MNIYLFYIKLKHLMLKKTIDNYRNFLINNIEPNIFNIEFCIFAPISSLQLKNEMLIEKNFENYFRYFFNNFYDK